MIGFFKDQSVARLFQYNPESVISKWIKNLRYVVQWAHWFRVMLII